MESDPEVISRRLTLSKWILKFDKYLLSNPKLYEYVKEYFYESYKNSSDLRKELHNNFLPKLESELGFPSKKEFYDYNNFFKINNYDNYDLADFYYYDEDLNLFNRNNKNSKSVKNKNINESIFELSEEESFHSNYSSEIDINDSTESNDLIESNNSIQKYISQFSSSNEEKTKRQILKKLIALRKKLHKKKLSNFYKIIALEIKESNEDVREWISFEERLYRINLLSNNIIRELTKYIKVCHLDKFKSRNISSKEFFRIHFIGLIKVKIVDFRTTLKSYM